jgi:Tfp pilus assembly protein PilX
MRNSITKHIRQSSTIRYQTGVALVMALIILMLLTIIGVTAINMTGKQEKMASNFQDRQLARYLGESAVQSRANQNNMPASSRPGQDQNSWNLTSADISGLQQATVAFTFIEDTATSNLPSPKRNIQLIETGNYATFRINAAVSTPAGTPGKEISGYYWAKPTNPL